MSNYVFLFDVDMVLADWRHRVHFMQEDNLPAFYEAMPADPVIPAGVVLFNMLITQAQVIGHACTIGKVQGAEIPFVDVITCRPQSAGQITYEWFTANGLLAPRSIHMREDGDTRPHHVIKLEMYEKHYKGREEVLILFEDAQETVKAFRDIGITVYQTCESALPSRYKNSEEIIRFFQ